MASTTIGSSGVTFPDATTQSTAPVNTNANVTSATAVAGTGISISSVTTTGAATHTVTNTGVTSVTGAGTVSVSASTGAITITGTGGSGTVTSVATGNGLSGGTITTSGTLTIAAPNFNTVGSYCGIRREVSNGATCSGGTNLSTGSGLNQVQSWAINSTDPTIYYSTNNLSGTWKWMGADLAANQGCSIGVRVA